MNGVKTLAARTYAVSEHGLAAMLPAGTEIERVSGLIKPGPAGTLVVLADETAHPNADLVAWYIDEASA